MTAYDEGSEAAAVIRKEIAKVVRSLPIAHIIHCTVTATATGATPPTVTVTQPAPPGGHAVSQPNIRYLAGYTPTVGDVVVVVQAGADLWVLGKLHP